MSCSARAAACPLSRMAAWRVHQYGAPSELRLEEARVPPLRAPDQLLLRVIASSVNPIDVAMIGGYGRVALNTLRTVEGAVHCGGGGAGSEFPLVVGRDMVGEVVAAGSAAGGGLPRGQRVWGVVPPHWQGAHQQYVVTRAAWCAPAPTTLTDHEASGALYAGLTAAAACRAAGLLSAAHRARVLVMGAGGVGQAMLQLLVAGGARVSIVCAPELVQWALEAGAQECLDRHAEDYESRLVGPWDAVLDCAGLGGETVGTRAWQCGRYVTLTTPLLRQMDARGAVAGAAAAAWALARQNAAARHVAKGGVRWAYFAPLEADIARLGALAARGRLRPVVEAEYGWLDAPRAYQHQAQGHARGKIVIDFTDDTPPAAARAAPEDHC